MSTTTTPMEGGLLKRMVEALAPMGIPILATGRAPELPAGLGEHVRVVPFAPHDELLPRVSAFVTHGGWGSVGRGLRHGVPMLIIPNINDQPLIGRRLAEMKLAYHLPRKEASPEAIR